MTNLHERNSTEESSMEDILSSIRQILASDDASDEAPKEKVATKAKSSVSYQDDVIELTEEVRTTPASAPQKIEPTKKEEIHIMPITPEQEAKLISQKTVEAASQALSKLNEALHPAQPAAPVQHTSIGGSVTLEALVTQAMQPILREWMDQNLPQVIESVVTAEIKKLVRQAS